MNWRFIVLGCAVLFFSTITYIGVCTVAYFIHYRNKHDRWRGVR